MKARQEQMAAQQEMMMAQTMSGVDKETAEAEKARRLN